MPNFRKWSSRALRIGGIASLTVGASLVVAGALWLNQGDRGEPAEPLINEPTAPWAGSPATTQSSTPPTSADPSANDVIRALLGTGSAGSPTGYYPSVRTGNGAVDALLEALFADDPGPLLRQFEGTPCDPDSGMMAGCHNRPFASPDALVFSVYSCTETRITRADLKQLAETLALQESRVRAVLGPVDGPGGRPEYGVLIDGESQDWLAVVHADGGVSSVAYGCEGVLHDESRWSRATFLLPPRDPDLPPAPRTSTPTPYPAPSPVAGLEPIAIELGEDADLPAGLLLYYNVTCYGCEGSPGGLSRAYMDSTGTLRTRRLLDHPPRPIPGYVHSYALAEDGYEMVVAICAVGFCGGIAEATPDAELLLLRSTDGGITWADFGELPPESWVLGILADQVVVHTWTGPDSPSRDWLYPSGRDLSPPVEDDSAHPVLIHGLGLVWSYRVDDSSRRTVYYDAKGERLYDEIDRRLAASPATLSPDGRLFVVARDTDPSVQPRRTYLVTLDGKRELEAVYYWEGATFRIHQAVTPTLLLGSLDADDSHAPSTSASTGFRAVLIDLSTRTAHSIRGLPSGAEPAFAEFTVRGPFGEVATSGDCLNVRAQPAMHSIVLGCYLDGTLLRYEAVEQEADGRIWVAVATPGGKPGWVAAEYFDR